MSISFRNYALDQLRRHRSDIRDRSMFGGVGIYAGELFFALIADGTLYFKVDDSTRPAYEERGLLPFRPAGPDGETMQYYEVPADVLEDADRLGPWADAAIAVAHRKRTAKARKRGA